MVEQETVATASDGTPILGYVMPHADFPAFQALVQGIAKGKPYLIATNDLGDRLQVIVSQISLKDAEAISQQAKDIAQTHHFAEAAIPPNSLKFGND